MLHRDFTSMQPAASWVIRSNFSTQDISGPRLALHKRTKENNTSQVLFPSLFFQESSKSQHTVESKLTSVA